MLGNITDLQGPGPTKLKIFNKIVDTYLFQFVFLIISFLLFIRINTKQPFEPNFNSLEFSVIKYDQNMLRWKFSVKLIKVTNEPN